MGGGEGKVGSQGKKGKEKKKKRTTKIKRKWNFFFFGCFIVSLAGTTPKKEKIAGNPRVFFFSRGKLLSKPHAKFEDSLSSFEFQLNEAMQ